MRRYARGPNGTKRKLPTLAAPIIREVGVFKQQGYEPLRFSRRAEWLALAGFIGLCLCVGISGGGVSAVSVRAWYLSLARPPATLPDSLFAPIWAVLYVMMAVAAWIVWREPDSRRRRAALTLWGWQLLLNALWAPLFFGLHLMLPALGVIVGLFGVLAVTILRFRALKPGAAALMLPYLAWVAFAGYLNAGFWWLNH